MSDVEFAFLNQRAQAAGMTRSAYARAILGGTSLGDHFVGKVETATPGKGQNMPMVNTSAGGSGIAVIIRPEQPRRRALRSVPEPT